PSNWPSAGRAGARRRRATPAASCRCIHGWLTARIQELRSRELVEAGLRNFAWVEPGVLARGEQPSPMARRVWPAYHVQDEHDAVQRAGLRFRHVPMLDFSAPDPPFLLPAERPSDADDYRDALRPW